MAETERTPVYPLILGMGEMGRYDEDGSMRDFVHVHSGETIVRFALQEGHTGVEADRAMDEIARGLRRARAIRRRQKAGEEN